MTTSNKVLVSELPVEKLLEASMQLVRSEHTSIQLAVTKHSPILNPLVGGQPKVLIFDLEGLKDQLAGVEAGLAGAIENLRSCWQCIEHHCRVAGKPPERTIESISSMTNEKRLFSRICG